MTNVNIVWKVCDLDGEVSVHHTREEAELRFKMNQLKNQLRHFNDLI